MKFTALSVSISWDRGLKSMSLAYILRKYQKTSKLSTKRKKKIIKIKEANELENGQKIGKFN